MPSCGPRSAQSKPPWLGCPRLPRRRSVRAPALLNVMHSIPVPALPFRACIKHLGASSQSAETPREAKRQRYSEPNDPPLITMGPFPPTSMSALELFETHIHAAIPNHFRDAKPYRVERDPVISHNLHVSLQTTSQVKALTSAWAVNNIPGYRNIKMYTAGVSNESVSHTRPQYRSQRGGHQGQISSYNNYSSQNR
ncbi:hypothetical protein C8J57DRAFT_1232866 [Mycena rebaudengoi]|nr:hypothetical protein C8J57DRAFT_1232866 [Mycena rebaudengoi]